MVQHTTSIYTVVVVDVVAIFYRFFFHFPIIVLSGRKKEKKRKEISYNESTTIAHLGPQQKHEQIQHSIQITSIYTVIVTIVMKHLSYIL